MPPSQAAARDAKADRRPAFFWKTFNAWWRAHLERTGQRPTASHIALWYHEHAETVWGPHAQPTLAATRVHAKCLRSVDAVRKYFQNYRAIKGSRKVQRRASSQSFQAKDDEDTTSDSEITNIPDSCATHMPSSSGTVQQPAGAAPPAIQPERQRSDAGSTEVAKSLANVRHKSVQRLPLSAATLVKATGSGRQLPGTTTAPVSCLHQGLSPKSKRSLLTAITQQQLGQVPSAPVTSTCQDSSCMDLFLTADSDLSLDISQLLSEDESQELASAAAMSSDDLFKACSFNTLPAAMRDPFGSMAGVADLGGAVAGGGCGHMHEGSGHSMQLAYPATQQGSGLWRVKAEESGGASVAQQHQRPVLQSASPSWMADSAFALPPPLPVRHSSTVTSGYTHATASAQPRGIQGYYGAQVQASSHSAAAAQRGGLMAAGSGSLGCSSAPTDDLLSQWLASGDMTRAEVPVKMERSNFQMDQVDGMYPPSQPMRMSHTWPAF